MNVIILMIHDYSNITTEMGYMMSHTETKGYADR